LEDGQQQQQQQPHKLFTVHSFDLHISPPLHLKDLWDSLGVRSSIASLSGACALVDTCAPGDVSHGEINARNGIYLQPLPPPRTPRVDSPEQRAQLLTQVATCYARKRGEKNGGNITCSGALAGLSSADAVLTSHPFSLMQVCRDIRHVTRDVRRMILVDRSPLSWVFLQLRSPARGSSWEEMTLLLRFKRL
jgi:hypothetical protein